MSGDCLKLTTYFGERHRVGGAFLADALLDLYARHEIAVSVLLRGTEGFGRRHHLRTDRLLTLSEDLPIVSVAVDSRTRIEALLPEVEDMSGGGLVTLERARMLRGVMTQADLAEPTKLTLYLGRRERLGGRLAYVAVVELLRRHGVDGATVLLGVDGTAHGARRRARFFGANAAVPLMVISVGAGDRIAAALEELGELLDRPLITAERIAVCKRDGTPLGQPPQVPEADSSGLPLWQKLMIYTGEQARYRGMPLAPELMRRLRLEGATGATALRGIWGYHGDHAPHGDSPRQWRRRVPVTTIVIDRPPRIARWFDVVDELTADTGLVTSEMVPTAFRPI